MGVLGNSWDGSLWIIELRNFVGNVTRKIAILWR